MKWILYVLGCCLFLVPTSGLSDSCSDLQAAIAKTAALKQEMHREAAPFTASGQIPDRHEGVCKSAENLRSHLIVLGALIKNSQCLNEEEYKNLATSVDSSMKDASSNVSLFCN
jgi:hypothetical protein